MNKKFPSIAQYHDKGAAIPEYIILLMVFIPVFLFASTSLYDAMRPRAESNLGSSSLPAPCLPIHDDYGELIRPQAAPMCLVFRPQFCEAPYGPGDMEYERFCFCCYP